MPYAPGKQPSLVSVVVPVYQNAASLPDLYDRLQQVTANIADVDWELIFVDDGSTDESAATLERLLERDPRIRIVRLSRNFGSQAAILAGMTQARGQAIAVISADLQDPPELLDSLLAPWRAGTKVVLAERAGAMTLGLQKSERPRSTGCSVAWHWPACRPEVSIAACWTGKSSTT